MHHDQIIKGLKNIDLSIIQKRSEALEFCTNMLKRRNTTISIKELILERKRHFRVANEPDIIIDNIHEILKEIPIQSNNIETLFLRGEFSNYIEKEDYPTIEMAFPNSTIKTIENAGHWLHAENPVDFHKEVINFIA